KKNRAYDDCIGACDQIDAAATITSSIFEVLAFLFLSSAVIYWIYQNRAQPTRFLVRNYKDLSDELKQNIASIFSQNNIVHALDLDSLRIADINRLLKDRLAELDTMLMKAQSKEIKIDINSTSSSSSSSLTLSSANTN
ncbi:MAG TPA: hypothetical protein VJL60_03780, partial [Gammaproteobacteria bacterium]|nr:hypothetical protein [Gammaproteobacteria bacterium]